MAMPWFFFISITLLGAAAYSTVVKLVGESINPFLFGVVLTIAALIGHLIAAGVYWYFQGNEKLFTANTPALVYTIFAGLSIVAIDIGFFLAVKNGGLIISQMFWTIGGLILITGISYFFFQESLNLIKAFGLVLGLASLFLIIKG